MELIPCPHPADVLTPDYVQRMLIDPPVEQLRAVRRLIFPAGLIRPIGSQQFNERPVTVLGTVSRTPLKVSFHCPAFAGLTADGSYLACEAQSHDVELPQRGEFTLVLRREPPQLADRPTTSPVLLPARYVVAANGVGLPIARGNVNERGEVKLDLGWLPPTVLVSSSCEVQERVAQLRTRLAKLDGELLKHAVNASAGSSGLLLLRWSAGYAAWCGLDSMCGVEQFLTITERLLQDWFRDTAVVFNVEVIEPTFNHSDTATAFKSLEAAIDRLSTEWQNLLSVPLDGNVEIESTNFSEAGTHTEIVIQTKLTPIAFDKVALSAESSRSLSSQVSGVLAHLTDQHSVLTELRTELKRSSPGEVYCEIPLTQEERAQGKIRLFVRKELPLSKITLKGI